MSIYNQLLNFTIIFACATYNAARAQWARRGTSAAVRVGRLNPKSRVALSPIDLRRLNRRIEVTPSRGGREITDTARDLCCALPNEVFLSSTPAHTGCVELCGGRGHTQLLRCVPVRFARAFLPPPKSHYSPACTSGRQIGPQRARRSSVKVLLYNTLAKIYCPISGHYLPPRPARG